MPAKSVKQKKYMQFLKGNPKARLKVGMTEDQVDHFIKSPVSKSKGKKDGKR